MAELVTAISAWVTAAIGWFGDVFEWLTSETVFPFIAIGIGLMVVGMAFTYVRSILRG